MPRIVTYQCPDCSHRFRFMHHPSDEPPPNFCPGCGADMREPEAVFEPAAPAIRNTVVTTAVENTVDAVMKSSEVRQQIAAEITPGASASDFANLKVTDLPDRQREGDVYRPPPPSSAYVQAKQQYGLASGFGGAVGHAAQGFASQTGAGPYPYAGAQSAQQFQRQFAQNARAMQIRDQMNRG